MVATPQGGVPATKKPAPAPAPAPARPSAPSWYTASDPNIPSWEDQQLNALFNTGNLDNVPPEILAAITQAESSGQGGAINSAGYGGYFGLGAGHSYPGGVSSAGLLDTTGTSSYDQQAEIAASEFESLLQRDANNPYAAESNYQGGGSEGTNIFSALGIPTNVGSAAANALTGNAASQLGATGVAANQQEVSINTNAGLAAGQQQLTNTELTQQYQDALASLGIQSKGMSQQQMYETLINSIQSETLKQQQS
jgi:hypothetical protein